MRTETALPAEAEEIPLGMSNFDHSVDEGFEEALRASGVYGRHAGWNFNGLVWFDAASKQFVEEVYVYGARYGSIAAPSLEKLMREVNDEYGWD